MTQLSTTLKKPPALKGRYAAFVHAYVATGNRVSAYRQAGFSSTSKHAIEVQACRLLKKPEVAAYLQEVQQHLAEHALAEMSTEWHRTRRVRKQIAYQDPAELVDEATGKIKPIHEIPKGARKMIGGIKVSKDGDVELKLRDPHPHLTALEEKYAIMPDNQRPVQRVDITSGGLPLQYDAIRDELMALVTQVEVQGPLMLPAMLPQTNGQAESNGHV